MCGRKSRLAPARHGGRYLHEVYGLGYRTEHGTWRERADGYLLICTLLTSNAGPSSFGHRFKEVSTYIMYIYFYTYVDRYVSYLPRYVIVARPIMSLLETPGSGVSPQPHTTMATCLILSR